MIKGENKGKRNRTGCVLKTRLRIVDFSLLINRSDCKLLASLPFGLSSFHFIIDQHWTGLALAVGLGRLKEGKGREKEKKQKGIHSSFKMNPRGLP